MQRKLLRLSWSLNVTHSNISQQEELNKSEKQKPIKSINIKDKEAKRLICVAS